MKKQPAEYWEKTSASEPSDKPIPDTHKEVKQDPDGEANHPVKTGEGHLWTVPRRKCSPGSRAVRRDSPRKCKPKLAPCLQLLEWQPWKDTENECWQGRRQKRTLVCSWLNANSYSHYGNFYGGSSKQNKKLKVVTIMWSHHPFHWAHIWRI